jgi:uncharacterized protein (TIGR03437 family)
VKLTKFAGILLLLSTATGWHASAQTWDTSGNGLLNGTYYFREVFYIVGYQSGALNEASALYGSITFSGTGTYTCQVSFYDSSQGLETGNLSGTYSISASGYGFISNPLSSGDYVYGLVNSAGIFVGSTTETTEGFNDLFVAAPLASPAPAAGSFKGSYTIAGIDLSSGNPSSTLSYLLQMNPDGVSTLGTVSGTAYVGGGGSTKYPQSFTGSRYIASGGAMVVTFPNSTSNVVTGQKYLYISPDGNFIFGGSPQGFDMIIGVRTGSGASVGGLYYQAGLDQDVSQLLSADFANLDTYFGSLSASNDNIVGHQRLLSPFNGSAYDDTYADSYSAISNSGYNTPFMNYVVGTGGVRIGSGIGPYLGINVALPAPNFTGSGVYLSPTGVVNAASSAPFTAGVAPGELLTLYGTNLADSLVVASAIPFPSSLGNVQVMINGIAAPIYYVAPTQVSVIVPYEITSAIVQVQVITDGNPSNTVTSFLNTTSAGVFSVPPGGLGYGAVLHQDGSLVSRANPAQIGETVSVFLTGLGAVSPGIADGAAGPVSPLSETTNISADIGGTTATVTYQGLAPQLAGLYQVNLTIPAGLTAGDNDLDIAGPDSYTSEVLISIGGTAAAASTAEARTAKSRRPPPRIGKALLSHTQANAAAARGIPLFGPLKQ